MPVLQQARRRPYSRERKLFLQPLESRTVMAADVYVNDNWFVASDVDASGTLSAGDLVDNRLDVDGAATMQATFGETAFTDSQAAVDAAPEGGVAVILEGEYEADVTVNKALTLEGANAGIAAGVNAETRGDETVLQGGIQVTADDVTIDGLTIEGGVDVVGDTAGVFLAAGASETTVTNNILTGDGVGRGVLSSLNGDNDNLLIQANEISGWTTGIFNQSNETVEVLDNYIHDNVSGVANDGVIGGLIQGNDFKQNDEAIGSLDSTDLTVTENDLADNLVAVANYGGEQITAVENFFGTVDLAEIDELVTGDVLFDSPLADSPFDIDEVTDLVFTGPNGVTLTVNEETGAFVFQSGDLTVSGTGAVIKNGRLQIHTHDELGRKIDVNGAVDGSLNVEVKQLGKGVKKLSFALTAEAEATANS